MAGIGCLCHSEGCCSRSGGLAAAGSAAKKGVARWGSAPAWETSRKGATLCSQVRRKTSRSNAEETGEDDGPTTAHGIDGHPSKEIYQNGSMAAVSCQHTAHPAAHTEWRCSCTVAVAAARRAVTVGGTTEGAALGCLLLVWRG
jgi:hypothetical protein